MSEIEILYKGRGYAVLKKPVGADSEDKGEGSVPDLARRALGVTYAEPVHRLDRAVGGAILVATEKKSAARLSREVALGNIIKEYLCVCEGSFDLDEGDMEDLLYYDRSKQKSFPVKRARRGVKRASLSYKVLGTRALDGERKISLVHVILHTGRTHQIRVQFSSRGHSLLGDGKYGSRDKTDIALLCHAVTVDGIRVECQSEDAYPWNLF